LRPSLKSEILATIFGVLIILIDFGDSHVDPAIGNLDQIFGHSLWPVVDIIFPLATITVFLCYAKEKGNGQIKLSAKTILPFVAYLLVLFLISVDDVAQVLRLSLSLSETYWIVMMVLFPIISFISFFSLNLENREESKQNRQLAP